MVRSSRKTQYSTRRGKTVHGDHSSQKTTETGMGYSEPDANRRMEEEADETEEALVALESTLSYIRHKKAEEGREGENYAHAKE